MRMQKALIRSALLPLLGVIGWTNLSAQSLSTGDGRRSDEIGRKNDRLIERNAGLRRMPSRLPTRIDTRLSTRLDDRYHVVSNILRPLEQSKATMEIRAKPR